MVREQIANLPVTVSAVCGFKSHARRSLSARTGTKDKSTIFVADIIIIKENGRFMERIQNNGVHEKHMPVVTVSGNKVVVEVGAIEHPMTDGHHIELIAIETTRGNQSVKLAPFDKPRVEFELVDGAELIAAYEYCNLHGFWKMK